MLSAITKYEERALKLARVLGRRMQAYSIGMINVGRMPRPSAIFFAKQVPLLTELMVVANLRGRLDAHKAAKRAAPDYELTLASEGPIFDKTIEIMRKTLGSDINLKSLEAQYNIVALRTLSNVSDTIEKDIRATAYGLIERGATVKEAKVELGKRFDALGLTPRNSFQLETIFRTASSVAYGAGSWAAYQDPDIQEILWGYQYTAVMDDRTRENHAAAEGVTLPKDDEFWQRMWPPNGYNCRCEIIPIFSREPVQQPPPEAIADPGFGYNPGVVLGELRDTTGVASPPPPKPLPSTVLEPPTTPEVETPAPAPIDIVEPAPVEPAPAEPAPAEPAARIPVSKADLQNNVPGEGEFTVPTEQQQLTWAVGEKWNPITRQYDPADPADIAAQVAPYVKKLSAQTGLDFQPEVVRNTPPATLMEWAKAASAMVTKFSKILENVKIFSIDRNSSEFRGYLERQIPRGRAYRHEKRVDMLAKRVDELRRENIESVSSKWAAKMDDPDKNGAQATTVHELGHQIGYELERENAQDYNTWGLDWARTEQADKYVSKNHSEYAGWALRAKGFQSFRAELTAEAFVEIMFLDRSKWSIITRELVRMLERRGYDFN